MKPARCGAIALIAACLAFLIGLTIGKLDVAPLLVVPTAIVALLFGLAGISEGAYRKDRQAFWLSAAALIVLAIGAVLLWQFILAIAKK